jgi:hypothetical protein
MSQKINLPGENWALLRDPGDVSERLRRPFVNLQRRLIGSGVGKVLMDLAPDGDVEKVDDRKTMEALRPVIADPDFEIIEDLNDLLVVALVAEWSFEAPVTLDAVLDLPNAVRTALVAACEPLVGPLVGETPDEDLFDPASPTELGNG